MLGRPLDMRDHCGKPHARQVLPPVARRVVALWEGIIDARSGGRMVRSPLR